MARLKGVPKSRIYKHRARRRGAHQRRPRRGQLSPAAGRRGAHSAGARGRAGHHARHPSAAGRHPAGAAYPVPRRRPDCAEQAGRHGGARRQRHFARGDRADAAGTAGMPLHGTGAPARPRNLGGAADRAEAARAGRAARRDARRQDRKALPDAGGGALAEPAAAREAAAAQARHRRRREARHGARRGPGCAHHLPPPAELCAISPCWRRN